MTRILIVGAGGLGSRIAVALMAGGFGVASVEPGSAFVPSYAPNKWHKDGRPFAHGRSRVAEWKRNPLDRYRR